MSESPDNSSIPPPEMSSPPERLSPYENASTSPVSPPAAKWEKGSADDVAYQKYLRDYAEYEQKYAAYEKQVGAAPYPPQQTSPVPYQVPRTGQQGQGSLENAEDPRRAKFPPSPSSYSLPKKPSAHDPDAFRSPQQPAASSSTEAYSRAREVTELKNITGGMAQQQSPSRDSVPPVQRVKKSGSFKGQEYNPNQPRPPSLMIAGPHGASPQIMSPMTFLRSIQSPQSGGGQQPLSGGMHSLAAMQQGMHMQASPQGTVQYENWQDPYKSWQQGMQMQASPQGTVQYENWQDPYQSWQQGMQMQASPQGTVQYQNWQSPDQYAEQYGRNELLGQRKQSELPVQSKQSELPGQRQQSELPSQRQQSELPGQRQPRQHNEGGVIREVVKEVPVERVVYRDRIVEVPKIIEKVVEKVVYVNDQGVPVQHHDYERGPSIHRSLPPGASPQFSPAWGQSPPVPVGDPRMAGRQPPQMQAAPLQPPHPNVGVGLLLEKNLANNTFYVVKTVPGFAAHESGKFEYGDVVTLIDRRLLTDLDEEQVKTMMMGTEGSSVTLDVKRNEETKFQVKLLRTLPGSARDRHAVSTRESPMQVSGGLVVQTLDHAEIVTKSGSQDTKPKLPSRSMKTPDQANRTGNQFDHLLHAFMTPELVPPSPDFKDARSATKSPPHYDPNSPSKVIGANDPNNEEAFKMLEQIDEANREASDQIRRINEANDRVLHDLALENRRTEEEIHYRHPPPPPHFHTHAFPEGGMRMEPHMFDPRAPHIIHGAPAPSPSFGDGFFLGRGPHSLSQSFSEGLISRHPHALTSSFSEGRLRDAPSAMPYAPPMRPHILSNDFIHHGHPVLSRSISDGYMPRPAVPLDLSRSYGGSRDDYTPGPVIPLDLSRTGGSREDPRRFDSSFSEGRAVHFTPPSALSHSYSHEHHTVSLSPATQLSQSFSSGQAVYSPSEYQAKQKAQMAGRGYSGAAAIATRSQNPNGMKVAPTVRESDLRMYSSAGQALSGFVPGTNYSPQETNYTFEFEKGPQQTVQEPIGQRQQAVHGGQRESAQAHSLPSQPASDGLRGQVPGAPASGSVMQYLSGGYTVAVGEDESVET